MTHLIDSSFMPQSELLEPYMDQLKIDRNNPYLYESMPVEYDPKKRTVFILDAPSGAGKDTVMNALVEMGKVVQAVTGTSRGRRWLPVDINEEEEIHESLNEELSVEEYQAVFARLEKEGRIIPKESDSSYIWRRRMMEGETPEEYARELNLLEWDFHYGHMYGLAEEDFLRAFNQKDKATIIRTDVSGKETLRQVLSKYGNVVSITLVGDDWDSAEASISNRESSLTDEKIQKRIQEDKANMPRYIKTNFIIHNTRSMVGDKSGLDHTIQTMVSLIEKYS